LVDSTFSAGYYSLILGESYFNSKNYALSRSQTPERRELDYLRYLGASDETAKEVKIFGLSDFITGRFKTLSDKFYSDNSKLAVRRSIWELSFCIRHFGLLCRLRIYHL
jgi:ATP-binding cassette subfamily B protein